MFCSVASSPLRLPARSAGPQGALRCLSWLPARLFALNLSVLRPRRQERKWNCRRTLWVCVCVCVCVCAPKWRRRRRHAILQAAPRQDPSASQNRGTGRSNPGTDWHKHSSPHLSTSRLISLFSLPVVPPLHPSGYYSPLLALFPRLLFIFTPRFSFPSSSLRVWGDFTRLSREASLSPLAAHRRACRPFYSQEYKKRWNLNRDLFLTCELIRYSFYFCMKSLLTLIGYPSHSAYETGGWSNKDSCWFISLKTWTCGCFEKT